MALRLILLLSLTSSSSKGWVPLIDSTGVVLVFMWAKLCFRREPILCEKLAKGRMVKLPGSSTDEVLPLGNITQALGPKSETREARPNWTDWKPGDGPKFKLKVYQEKWSYSVCSYRHWLWVSLVIIWGSNKSVSANLIVKLCSSVITRIKCIRILIAFELLVEVTKK